MSSPVTSVYIIGATGRTGGPLVNALLERPDEFVSHSVTVQGSAIRSTEISSIARKLLPQSAPHPQTSPQLQHCEGAESAFISSILVLQVMRSLSMSFVVSMLLYLRSSRRSFISRSHLQKQLKRQASRASYQATGVRRVCMA